MLECRDCGEPVHDDVSFRWSVGDDGVIRLEPIHPVHVRPTGEAA